MSLTLAIPTRAVIEDARRRQRRRRIVTGTVLLGLALALVVLLRPWSPGPGSPGAAPSVPARHVERQQHATRIPTVACVGPQHRIAVSPAAKRDYSDLVVHPVTVVLAQLVLHRLPSGRLAGLCLYPTPLPGRR